jgi:hypothetical protein
VRFSLGLAGPERFELAGASGESRNSVLDQAQKGDAALFRCEHGLCARHALQGRITFRPKTLPRPYHGPAQDLYQNAIPPGRRKQAKLDTDVKELTWLREQ